MNQRRLATPVNEPRKRPMFLALALACGACGGVNAAGVETIAPPATEPMASGESDPPEQEQSQPTELDGLVFWAESIDEAPDYVRVLFQQTSFLLENLEAAPRPLTPYSEAMSPAERADWHRWISDVYAPYWNSLSARNVAAGQPLGRAAASPEDRTNDAESRMVRAVAALIVTYGHARYLHDIEFGPPLQGSCHGTPDEELDSNLRHALATATVCAALAEEAEASLSRNGAECERRAQWCRTVLLTAEQDVCEVLVDGH